MTVTAEEFATHDPELAEDMIRQLYVDQRLSIQGPGAGFAFGHSSLAVTGRHAFAINRLHHTLGMRFESDPLDDLLVTNSPRRGALRVGDNTDFGAVAAGPGEVLLTAPTGHFTAQFVHLDVDVTALTRHEVAEHAAARGGIAPGSLRFTGLAPIDPARARLWLDTVAHVRDHVLADPEVAAIPLVLDSAFQTLATTLLATFPNTALDAADDPLARAPGGVGDTTVGHVVDHLHQHAAEPLGPADVAGLAGAPARDVDDALRQRRNTTLAEELWNARMAGAHRDLHDGDAAAGDTVAAIAARWGFTNPATFAVAYGLRSGGRSPEDTLRR